MASPIAISLALFCIFAGTTEQNAIFPVKSKTYLFREDFPAGTNGTKPEQGISLPRVTGFAHRNWLRQNWSQKKI
jgi:hypothetical protein